MRILSSVLLIILLFACTSVESDSEHAGKHEFHNVVILNRHMLIPIGARVVDMDDSYIIEYKSAKMVIHEGGISMDGLRRIRLEHVTLLDTITPHKVLWYGRRSDHQGNHYMLCEYLAFPDTIFSGSFHPYFMMECSCEDMKRQDSMDSLCAHILIDYWRRASIVSYNQ